MKFNHRNLLYFICYGAISCGISSDPGHKVIVADSSIKGGMCDGSWVRGQAAGLSKSTCCYKAKAEATRQCWCSSMGKSSAGCVEYLECDHFSIAGEFITVHCGVSGQKPYL